MPIIDYLGENGVQGVVLIGGEPLTRPDLEEISGRLAAHGITVKIATNAILATEERAKSLVLCGARKFHVSVEGASSLENDRVRGKGTFYKILSGAQNLQAAGGEVSLAITVTRQNYRSIPSLFKMIEGAGLKRVKFNAFVPIGTGAFSETLYSLTPSICREASESIAVNAERFPNISTEAGAFYRPIGFGPHKEASGSTLGCGAGTSSLIINSDFTLSACDMLVESDRTSSPIDAPADIAKYWRENVLFRKWRGHPDPRNSIEMDGYSEVHQNGCNVAYNLYKKNIFKNESET